MSIRLSAADVRKLGIAPKKRRSHEPGVMNKLESRFATQLEAWRLSGEVTYWKFEPSKLSLATNTTYTPDFYVLWADGLEVMYECKGFMREDASVKIKVAARLFPMYQFVIVKFKKGEWVFKTVKP